MLEASPFQPMIDLVPSILQEFGLSEQMRQDRDMLFKLKYSVMVNQEFLFRSAYSHDMMPNRILLEINLELDQFKSTTSRVSNDIYEMLGDVGGLQQVLWIAVGIFAEYFSSKFYA